MFKRYYESPLSSNDINQLIELFNSKNHPLFRFKRKDIYTWSKRVIPIRPMSFCRITVNFQDPKISINWFPAFRFYLVFVWLCAMMFIFLTYTGVGLAIILLYLLGLIAAFFGIAALLASSDITKFERLLQGQCLIPIQRVKKSK